MKTLSIFRSRARLKFVFIFLCLVSSVSLASTQPLEFASRPQYPITVGSGTQGSYLYVLRNNTNTTLPLQFKLSDPAHFQIGSNQNSCGNSIPPMSTCQFPLVVTAPTTSTTQSLRGDLIISYRGRYALSDSSINFTVTLSGGALTIQPSTSNRHLQYQALFVQNLSANPGRIASISLSNNLSNLVKECKSGDASCEYQSTCNVNSTIAPGSSCFIWFRSLDSNQSNLGFGQVIGLATINDGNSDQQFFITYDMNLFIGGSFTSPATRIARWNGSSWFALSSGANGTVQALAIYKGDLFAGGNFPIAGGITVNDIASWNGAVWQSLPPGPGLTNQVQSLLVNNDLLYVGGDFLNAGGILAADRIASWDGSNWQAFAPGLNNDVRALTIFNSNLYAGGDFTQTQGGGTTLNRIGFWDGSDWQALLNNLTGLNNRVNALSVFDGDLIAGGRFTNADGIAAADRIASWNGSMWSALGPGADNGEVFALAVNGSQLYVGGSFNSIGGDSNLKEIAIWNGSAWEPIGSGLSSTVLALLVHDGNLIAGGNFTNAGGNALADRIAIWDGTQWNALNGGANSSVFALAIGSSIDIT